jgi:nucleotide-binding universal stress UspA family protein
MRSASRFRHWVSPCGLALGLLACGTAVAGDPMSGQRIAERWCAACHVVSARTSLVSPGDFLLTSGRPVLVAPPQVDTLSARCIVVGWKDTREARRAVRDSLPLLATADEVFVIAVGTETALESAQDVAAYLARHGIERTTTLKLEPAGSIAEEILNTAARVGADLVVSGAYGRSRLREWTFGGVTRELLGHAPVCCLLSH